MSDKRVQEVLSLHFLSPCTCTESPHRSHKPLLASFRDRGGVFALYLYATFDISVSISGRGSGLVSLFFLLLPPSPFPTSMCWAGTPLFPPLIKPLAPPRLRYLGPQCLLILRKLNIFSPTPNIHILLLSSPHHPPHLPPLPPSPPKHLPTPPPTTYPQLPLLHLHPHPPPSLHEEIHHRNSIFMNHLPALIAASLPPRPANLGVSSRLTIERVCNVLWLG